MSHKKRSEWEDDFVDTGKVFVDDSLEEQIDAKKHHKDEKQNESNEKVTEKAEEKANEYLEMAQRLQAEFDNYRRRNLDTASRSRQEGIVFAVENLLPVLDTIVSAKKQIVDDNLAKAIELIYKQTLDCFTKLGVQKIDALGKPFDPNFHNAIMTEHVDGVEPDIVLDEFQEGFILDGKVIRHSVVKVSS